MITKEQLKRARMMALLSQYEAAALVGVHGVTYSGWENGNRPINQAAAQLFILKTAGKQELEEMKIELEAHETKTPLRRVEDLLEMMK